MAVGPGAGQGSAAESGVGPRVVRTVPLVSPLRGVEVSGTIDVAFAAVAERLAPPPVMAADDEAPLPEEVVAELISAEQLPTEPVQAAEGKSLHLTFMPGAAEEVEAAFKVLREIVHERPGETPLVLHIPASGGRIQRMELRVGVAYDAELVALINRRLGQRFVRVNLA